MHANGFEKYGVDIERYRNKEHVTEASINYQQFVDLSRPAALLRGKPKVVRRSGGEYDDYYTSWAVWEKEPCQRAGGKMLMRKYVLGDGKERELGDPNDGPLELSWKAYEKLAPCICNRVVLIGLNPAEPSVEGVQPRPWSFFHCDNYEDPCFVPEGGKPTGKTFGRNTDWKLRRYFAADREVNLSQYSGAFMTDIIRYVRGSREDELVVAEETQSSKLRRLLSMSDSLDLNFEVLYCQLKLLNTDEKMLILPAGRRVHGYLTRKTDSFLAWVSENAGDASRFQIPKVPLYHWSCRRRADKRISEVLECIKNGDFVKM